MGNASRSRSGRVRLVVLAEVAPATNGVVDWWRAKVALIHCERAAVHGQGGHAVQFQACGFHDDHAVSA